MANTLIFVNFLGVLNLPKTPKNGFKSPLRGPHTQTPRYKGLYRTSKGLFVKHPMKRRKYGMIWDTQKFQRY